MYRFVVVAIAIVEALDRYISVYRGRELDISTLYTGAIRQFHIVLYNNISMSDSFSYQAANISLINPQLYI